MDFESWVKLFGVSADDARLKTALAAVGVKKIPKLVDGETSVQLELKGRGLELIMTDATTLKNLARQAVEGWRRRQARQRAPARRLSRPAPIGIDRRDVSGRRA